MQFTSLQPLALAFALAALSSGAWAQTLPPCAETCAVNAIGASGCASTDAHCLCTNNAFIAAVEACIQTSCSAADQAEAMKYAQKFCGAGTQRP
ncbi:hypothetical protein GSI_11172 [Ganoderma sinense ZZ0214-1]|uniref:CFEM domain-containing protein n=1 Tax=Ganoderma sinense ZZ0214-1 TaxID=1077348 RepID=A0A2G8RZ42_9APHY|nr:hypothetical protein GSI_11172 [Ganoderma sinense ZZ0214-1]